MATREVPQESHLESDSYNGKETLEEKLEEIIDQFGRLLEQGGKMRAPKLVQGNVLGGDGLHATQKMTNLIIRNQTQRICQESDD